jgi:exopolyphosphatase/guanosine-5'-triphosphate,3'-diphosphate pyrophosphatase
MPGFTARERLLIANLCRYHRKALPSADHTNLSALPPDDRKALLRLIPLLRLADALDRSHAQHVASLGCSVRNGQVLVQLEVSADASLEQWAAGRVSDLFRQVYGKPLLLAWRRLPR